MDDIQDLSARRNTDPDALSSKLRNTFRAVKKADKRKREEEDGVRDKFALPKTLALVSEEDVREEAREEWERSRMEFQRDEDVRRKRFEAQHGTLGLNERRRAKPTSTSAPITQQSRVVPAHSLASTILRNSLKRKDPFGSGTGSGRLSAKDVGILSKR